MLKFWELSLENSWRTPRVDIQDDLKTLAFHILNRAGFGVRLQWPGMSETQKQDRTRDLEDEVIMDGNELEGGQRMRFGEAMLLVVDHLKELFIFPKWVLSERSRYGLFDAVLIECRACSFKVHE
jgi:hypothetical protein